MRRTSNSNVKLSVCSLHQHISPALTETDLPTNMIVKSQPQATCFTQKPDRAVHKVKCSTSSV